MHVSFALRPGKGFVIRLLLTACMPASAAFTSGISDPNRRVILGLVFHDELEFRRWCKSKGLALRGGYLCSPVYDIVVRPPTFSVVTDASNRAIGGYYTEAGHNF